MPESPNKIKKTLLLMFLCILPAGVHAETASPDSDGSGLYNERAAQNVIWESKLRKEVEFYSDSLCAGRAIGTRGGSEAAFAIIKHFRKSGLIPLGDSYAQAFRAPDSIRVGHNIIGMIPGSRKRPVDSYIIVGAHYDHLGTINGKMFPGADNNASGLVGMLSLAEMFSSMRLLGKVYDSSIIFVAFDGKELSMSGAESLWKKIAQGSLKDPLTGRAITREKIRLMVNLDQIGSSLSPLGSGREDYIIMLGGKTLPDYANDWFSLSNRFYDVNLELADTYYGSENFTKLFYRLSDQRPFVDNKVPAVMFTSGITFNNNKTYDSPSTLNYPVMRRRIILIYHWLDKLL